MHVFIPLPTSRPSRSLQGSITLITSSIKACREQVVQNNLKINSDGENKWGTALGTRTSKEGKEPVPLDLQKPSLLATTESAFRGVVTA